MSDSRAKAFEAHERSQARARLELTHRERLLWLEQAKAFARKAVGAARSKSSGRHGKAG